MTWNPKSPVNLKNISLWDEAFVLSKEHHLSCKGFDKFFNIWSRIKPFQQNIQLLFILFRVCCHNLCFDGTCFPHFFFFLLMCLNLYFSKNGKNLLRHQNSSFFFSFFYNSHFFVYFYRYKHQQPSFLLK